jgi:hypothetical protein
MFKIFYSWESDLPSSKNNAFIRGCIDRAIELAEEAETIEAERDESTKDLTGSPDIVNSIFDKIDEADMFIGDVSLCFTTNQGNGKKSPNPNVLIELGYAIRVLGWDRIICVFNKSYGKPEELPFDIQHHRLLTYSFDGKSNNEVKMDMAETIFKDIRDLRNKPSLVKAGVPLHVVGYYDPVENSVIQDLLPVDLRSRVDLEEASKLKESALCLYEGIVNLTERMTAEKVFQEETIEMMGDEEKTFLKTLQKDEGFNSMEQLLSNIESITDPFKKNAKPVTAYQPDSVKHWLRTLLDIVPSEDFFSFGSLSKSVFDMGFAGKQVKYYGSEDEKEKHHDYCELYRTLYLLWLRMSFPAAFDNYLFFHIAIQNVSQTMDKDIRIVLSIVKGRAIYPTKELISEELADHRGQICHEGLVDKLFSVPQLPLIEQEYSPSQIVPPKHHVDLLSGKQDTEDDEDYENNLQQFILTPESKTHYNTIISRLRAKESRWLSGGILIKPVDGEVKIDYCIHSALLTGEIKGSLEYHT